MEKYSQCQCVCLAVDMPPVNENLMELFHDALPAAGVGKSITAVIPYFGYARQDRKMSARVPISASDVAMLFEAAGVDRVLAVDLHCGQIQGFHNTPVDNLSTLREFAPFVARVIKGYGDDPICIVSPDAGGARQAVPGGAHNDELQQHYACHHCEAPVGAW